MSFATFVGKYSPEVIIRDGLRELNCSIRFLCAVTEDARDSSLVSSWLAGKKNMDDSDTRPLVETIRTLKEIVAVTAPWPLDFRNNCQLWKQLLEEYRKNKEAAK